MKQPISFRSIDDLPNLVVSLSTMEHNHTGAWRYIRPQYENKVPPCSNRCPAGNDIESLMTLAAEGRFGEAWRVLKEENPLTRVCGRVCFHPCETACNRARFDAALSVNALERFVGEHADRAMLADAVRPASGKRVAIVGSGPAGLSAAWFLARLGHQVTIFEKQQKPGGLLRYGIPEHRLPRSVLDDEIEDIASLGVEIRCGQGVGPGGIGYDELESFDAVFLAIGAGSSRKLGIPGEEGPRVMSGLALLSTVADSKRPDVGSRAVVIGGGNTALDAARVLVRLGAAVDVHYRRSQTEMPAFAEEVAEAVREGVGLHLLVSPVRVNRDAHGRVTSVTFVRMELGEPDESGRRRPVLVEGSEHDVEADTVVSAVGELVDIDALPSGVETERDGSVPIDDFGQSTTAKLWAGGDVTPRERTVVDAVRAGKLAAVAIDRYLAGEGKQGLDELMRVGASGAVSMSQYLKTGVAHQSYDSATKVVGWDDINPAHFEHADRAKPGMLALGERLSGFGEVKGPLRSDQARQEAERCFHCGVCNQCDNCYVFCPDVAVMPKADGNGYELNLDYCKGCGICAEECPRGAITMLEEPS